MTEIKIKKNGWIEAKDGEDFVAKKLNTITIGVFSFVSTNKNLLYVAKKCNTYKDFTDELIKLKIVSTFDNVSLSDIDLDYDFLDEFIGCLK